MYVCVCTLIGVQAARNNKDITKIAMIFSYNILTASSLSIHMYMYLYMYLSSILFLFLFRSISFQVGDLYASDGGYATDPWVPHAAAAHYGSYAHAAHAHAAHAHAYHHNMAQYGSLLRLPQQYSHGTR